MWSNDADKQTQTQTQAHAGQGENLYIRRTLLMGGQIVCIASVVLLAVLAGFGGGAASMHVAFALAFNFLLGVGILLAVNAGMFRLSMLLVAAALLLVTGVGVFAMGYGLKSTGFILYIPLICASTLFFGSRAGWQATAVGLLCIVGTYAMEKAGWVLAAQSDRQGTVLTTYIALLILLTVVFIITRVFLERHASTQKALIRESRELEEALAARQLAEKESSEFFAALSHAIRTPMVGIESGLQLLRDERIAPAKRDVYLRALRRSARELELFVLSLLDFRASRRGLLVADLSTCHLGQFLGDVWAQLKSVNSSKPLHWEFHLDARAQGYVMLDQRRLRQVLTILVSNAVKYCQAEATVSFSAVPFELNEGTEVWAFTVSDTGPGIDAATLSRIFQPFTQNADGQENQTAGTGIGLALAQELCVLMGGSLHVNSEVGKGSRFWLLMPLQRAGQGDIV